MSKAAVVARGRLCAFEENTMSTRWGNLKTTHIAVVQRQGGVRGAKLVVLLLGDRHGAKETVARENQFKPENAETQEYLQRRKPHLHTKKGFVMCWMAVYFRGH